MVRCGKSKMTGACYIDDDDDHGDDDDDNDDVGDDAD